MLSEALAEADKMPKDIDGVNMLRRLAFDVGFEEGVKTHRSTYCALLRKAAGEEWASGLWLRKFIAHNPGCPE